jgi:hypothetical protein
MKTLQTIGADRPIEKRFAPTTPANAILHGMAGDTDAAFHALLANYRAELRPQTPRENLLVDQIAQSRWRLDRILETLSLEQIVNQHTLDESNPPAKINRAKILNLLQRSAKSAEQTHTRMERELNRSRSRNLRNKADGIPARPNSCPRNLETASPNSPIDRPR